jgi:hypothetical protein
MQAPDEDIFGLQPIVFQGNLQNAENNQQMSSAFAPRSAHTYAAEDGFIGR